MSNRLVGAGDNGLERSCADARPDWVRSRDPAEGVQLLQAWFSGRGYETHRHDTYAIGITDVGVQAFDYRGAAEASLPGQVVVLHPDEAHDGRAGTTSGFGYRIVYLAPAHIAEAARAIRGRPAALPFVRDPVLSSPRLAQAIESAFQQGDEPLAVDGLVLRLAEALLDADRSAGAGQPERALDLAAIGRARDYLDAELGRVVQSSELETVIGLTRYDLARQFRAAVGTSPYRYSVMRRLDRARGKIRQTESLADLALGVGFADQAHFSRMFKAAFGITPARYRRLVVAAHSSD